MKRISVIIVLFFVLLLASCASTQKNADSDPEKILSAAEKIFFHMQDKNYPAIWGLLSAKSQSVIINDVRKGSKKAGFEQSNDDLLADFESGGPMAKAYWDNYLFVFNPDMVLRDCQWEMGQIKSNEAEVILKYKNSDRPAIIKLFQENNVWKVGLEETFGARRLNPF